MNVFYKSASRHLNRSRLSHVRATIVGTTRACLKGLLLTAIFVSVGVSAQTISPQMIQQLQSMPRAQQEAMAKQYGIDLDQVLGGAGAKGAATDLAMPGAVLEQRALGDTDLESQSPYHDRRLTETFVAINFHEKQFLFIKMKKKVAKSRKGV